MTVIQNENSAEGVGTQRIAIPSGRSLRDLHVTFAEIHDKPWTGKFLAACEATVNFADKGIVNFDAFRMHSKWIEGVEVAELKRTWLAYLSFLEKTGARVERVPSIDMDDSLWRVLI